MHHCHACRRHLLRPTTRCPFCASRSGLNAPSCSLVLALSLGAMATACADRSLGNGDGSEVGTSNGATTETLDTHGDDLGTDVTSDTDGATSQSDADSYSSSYSASYSSYSSAASSPSGRPPAATAP